MGARSLPFPEAGNHQNNLSSARSAAIIFFRVTRVTPPEAKKPVAAESGYFGIRAANSPSREHAHSGRETFQLGAENGTQGRGWWRGVMARVYQKQEAAGKWVLGRCLTDNHKSGKPFSAAHLNG